MIRFLLDTNILSELIRNPRGILREKIGQCGERKAYTSIIVSAELQFGAARKRSARLSARIDIVLASFVVVPFAAPVDRVYGELRAELEKIGRPIGRNDLLIAAQAVHDGSVLVTDNVREFSRVPKLTVENWLRP